MGVEKIRLLKAREIECRVGTCKENGFSLLLYKNARVDMDILDEAFTPTGWQREHVEIKGHLFCRVSVMDGDRWIVKEDVGTESNAEATKGEASDSFKRACVNVGIGRELYTAPFIWVNKPLEKYAKYRVADIGYNSDREINLLKINDGNDQQIFFFSNQQPQNAIPPSGTPSNPFTEPKKEPSLKDSVKDAGRIEKIKREIGEMGKNPVLTEDEKVGFRESYAKLKDSGSYEELQALYVEMELAVESKKR